MAPGLTRQKRSRIKETKVVCIIRFTTDASAPDIGSGGYRCQTMPQVNEDSWRTCIHGVGAYRISEEAGFAKA